MRPVRGAHYFFYLGIKDTVAKIYTKCEIICHALALVGPKFLTIFALSHGGSQIVMNLMPTVMKINHFLAVLLLGGTLTSCGGSSNNASQTDSLTTDSATTVIDTVATDTTSAPGLEQAVDETGQKYVPSSIGDCFIGERIRVPNDSGQWCEITFNPDGTCVLKTENNSLSGTFNGTVNGDVLKIAVRFSNGEEYDFVGTKTNLVADDGLVKYVVSIEM